MVKNRMIRPIHQIRLLLAIFAICHLPSAICHLPAQRFLRTYPTIEALLAANPSDIHSNAFVSDPIRGGFFEATTNLATTNLFKRYRSTNGVAEWLRRHHNSDIYLRWSGHIPTTNHVIQAALDLHADTGVGTVYLPSGNNILDGTTPIVLKDNNTLWAEDNCQLTVAPSPATNVIVFDITSKTNIRAGGFLVHGWGQPPAANTNNVEYAFSVANSKDIYLYGVIFTNLYSRPVFNSGGNSNLLYSAGYYSPNTRAFPTIQAMIDSDPTELHDTCYVVDYSTPLDRGGGHFRYYAGSTLPTNAGYIFAPRSPYSGRYVRLHNSIWVTPEQFGAYAAYSTNVQPQLQAAADYAAANNLSLYFAPGQTYKINSTVTIRCNLLAAGSFITTTNLEPFIFLKVGYEDGNVLSNKVIALPTLSGLALWTTNATYNTNDAGIKVSATQNCIFTGGQSKYFTYGLWLESAGNRGITENSFSDLNLYHNKIGVLFEPIGTGWVNENTFIRCSISHASGLPWYAPNMRFIEMRDSAVGNDVNNNNFIACMLEGSPEYHVLSWGIDNLIDHARWETFDEILYPARVHYQTNAVQNLIRGGYASDFILISEAGSGNHGNDLHSIKEEIDDMSGSGSRSSHVWRNRISNSAPVLTVHETTPDIYNRTYVQTNWNFSLSAQDLRTKNDTDSGHRFRIDHASGDLYWANGAGTEDIRLYRSAADSMQSPDLWRFDGGIGTGATPTSTLNWYLQVNQNAATSLYIRNTDTGSSAKSRVLLDTASNQFELNVYNSAGLFPNRATLLGGSGGTLTGMTLYVASGDDIDFYPGATRAVAFSSAGQLQILRAGQTLAIKEGSNSCMGTAVLVAGTVTVSTTAVTASSRIFTTIQTAGGTVGVHYISARSAGTSFTVTSSSASDTSTIAWHLFEPAP
jgi:hypothetical protein